MLQISSGQLVGRLGLFSPWCLSSGCHYLEPDEFHGDSVMTIEDATRSHRIYCFERDSGKVAAAFHWFDDDPNQRLRAIALRGAVTGPVDGTEAQHVHAAGVFALGVVQYRALAAGKSGVLVADTDIEGGWSADLRALGFQSASTGWRKEAPAKWSSRLNARLALARLRVVTWR